MLVGRGDVGEEDIYENVESRSEEKSVGFSSAFLFHAKKRKAVTRVETMGIYHPTRRRTHGAGFVKGWEEKQDRGCTPNTFT